jgi:hypothetical protein
MIMLFVDWTSLVKAKVILNLTAKTIRVGWTVSFIIVDASAYLNICLIYLVQIKLFNNIAFVGPLFAAVHAHISPDTFADMVIDASLFAWILINFYVITKQVTAPLEIMMASTMLTSVWVVLFLISLLLLKLLVPLEYLRRFTLWWFKDIDAHPLRDIAKVAATLIVIGAFALKAVRWGWMMF